MNVFPKRKLQNVYRILYTAFGPQHWWPGETPFEVMVGAILTQNTNWGNVEKALNNLKNAKVLTPAALHEMPLSRLARLIKPSGFFNVKARRLKNFLDFLFEEYGGSIARMRRVPIETLRKKILNINGIGPETADSILLYALDKPVFVVDAYTKRFLSRHNFIAPGADYHDIQELFMKGMRADPALFNEYHALIVRLGKDFCRPRPRCDACPLKSLPHWEDPSSLRSSG